MMSITESTMSGLSRRIADTFISQCNEHGEHEYVLERWAYVPGMLLMAVARAGVQHGESEYLSFMQRHMNSFIGEDGSIRTYSLEEYNLDQINQGKNLFYLYTQTGEARYAEAAHLLAAQLIGQPRTSEGDSGIRRCILSKCGWTDYIWLRRFLPNTAPYSSVPS